MRSIAGAATPPTRATPGIRRRNRRPELAAAPESAPPLSRQRSPHRRLPAFVPSATAAIGIASARLGAASSRIDVRGSAPRDFPTILHSGIQVMTIIATANPSAGPMPAAPRPIPARTKLLLEAPILPTLLRLSAPNVLNLLALAGMITFDGLFLGRLGSDALAGVSLVFPWVMITQLSANGGMGGGVSS